MLPRAALRSIRPSFASSLRPTHPRTLSPATSNTASCSRAYASKAGKPPPRGTPSPKTPGAKPPPPAQPFPKKPSGPARQTSPGTSVPKDKTWKPKDDIKFGGAAAGASAGAAAAARSADTPIDGTRPEDTSSTRPASPLEPNAKPEEPLAQKADADEPVPGGVRDTAQQAQAAAENTPPPSESESAPEPQQPLPDLRQGIPSSFDMEFGQGKQKQQEEQSQDEKSEDEPERRERKDREYERSDYETSLDRKRAQMANYLYLSMAFIALTGGFYLARPYNAREDVPPHLEDGDATGWTPGKMWARIRARFGSQIGHYTEPVFPKLLPEVPESQRPPYTLVLSLEDLMIHTTWDREHGYRTAKRPGIDYFIRYLSQYYELVLFTSVPITMADPVMRKLDPFHFIMWPLGREATKYESGEYVKDLAYLNRPLNKTLIVDTHAPHVKNQPENAIILPKWKGDPKDPQTKDLVALIPFLEYVATMGIDDVRSVIKSFEGKPIPEEFARREAEARRKFNEGLDAERAKKPRFSMGSIAGAMGVKSTPAAGGGMVLADGQSVAEGLAQGKMLSDQIREQGQKQYEFLEKQIREHGEQWLKEEEEEQKKMMDAQMKEMKKGAFGWFGGGGSGGKGEGEGEKK